MNLSKQLKNLTVEEAKVQQQVKEQEKLEEKKLPTIVEEGVAGNAK